MDPLFHHRCTIERATVVSDNGYENRVWRPHLQRVRCQIQESKGSFLVEPPEIGDRLEVDGVIFFPRKTDVRPRHANDSQDRAIITRPSSPGGTFLIQFVSDESGMADLCGLGCLKALVKRVMPDDAPPP